MPIVIDEIEISIVAAPPAATPDGAEATPNTEALVKLCVEKVLEVLNQKMER
jgi:hypothetical protein